MSHPERSEIWESRTKGGRKGEEEGEVSFAVNELVKLPMEMNAHLLRESKLGREKRQEGFSSMEESI